MLDISEDLPVNFAGLSDNIWNQFKGSLFGSAQPGYYWVLSQKDEIVLNNLKAGMNLTDAGVDPWMYEELAALNSENFTIIYSLASPNTDRNPLLVKQIWENEFKKLLKTEINDLSIQVEDFEGASVDQLEAIANDVIKNLKKGEKILITCGAGLGRTGTALAAIFMKITGINDVNCAISYIKHIYSPRAIEGDAQYNALVRYAEYNKANYNTEVDYDVLKKLNKTITSDVIDKSKNSLVELIISGDLKQIKKMLEDGIDVNTSFPGKFPLIEATRIGKPSIVKLLIEHGANLDVIDEEHQTSLIKAVLNPSKISLKVMDILLSHNASVNIKDAEGNDALYYLKESKNKNSKYKINLLKKYQNAK